MFDREGIINFLKIIDDVLDTSVTLVAAGGTSMVLRNYKTVTNDVDFTVPVGYSAFTHALNVTRTSKQVDSWVGGEIYVNELPSDYMEIARHEADLENIKLFSLHPVDVICTKIGRLNNRDRDDIEALIRNANINASNITDRVKQMSYTGLKATYWDNLREVMKTNFNIDPNQ